MPAIFERLRARQGLHGRRPPVHPRQDGRGDQLRQVLAGAAAAGGWSGAQLRPPRITVARNCANSDGRSSGAQFGHLRGGGRVAPAARTSARLGRARNSNGGASACGAGAAAPVSVQFQSSEAEVGRSTRAPFRPALQGDLLHGAAARVAAVQGHRVDRDLGVRGASRAGARAAGSAIATRRCSVRRASAACGRPRPFHARRCPWRCRHPAPKACRACVASVRAGLRWRASGRPARC